MLINEMLDLNLKRLFFEHGLFTINVRIPESLFEGRTVPSDLSLLQIETLANDSNV